MQSPKSESLTHNLLRHQESLNALGSHNHILLAVSGGSDSLALLHLLHEHDSFPNLSVATVDHGLRQEALEEAKMVAQICETLDLPHTILHNIPNEKKSAETARHSRYELLVTHAEQIGATAIVTAHTQDDQAETTLMRAMRIADKSHTGGLSAMAYSTTYRTTKLLRPLLHTTRQELQDYLTQKNINWISDPSNQDTRYERSRIRNLLNSGSTPASNDLAKFANLCGTSRLWLNRQTVTILPLYVESTGTELIFTPPAHLPTFMLAEILSLMVRLVSGSDYRLPLEKLQDSLRSLQQGTTTTRTAGRTIIKVSDGRARVTKETRVSYPSDNLGCPNLSGLLHFRPYYDDCLYDWADSL